jgi:putative ABC transport system substrate-binding protein
MNRRKFIALFGSTTAWPLDGWAQLPAVPVVGVLVSVPSSSSFQDGLMAFHQGLRETGFTVGQNVLIEYRWGEGNYDQLSTLAADLVRSKVDVIVPAFGVPAALAAKAATTTIPIVFLIGGDPVQVGLVASLGRPGGNASGYAGLAMVGGKQWEVLFEIVPNAAKLGYGFLVNPTHPSTEPFVRRLRVEADKRGHRLIVANARSQADFEGAFALLVEHGARALVIMDEPLFNVSLDQLAALAIRHSVPAIAGFRRFAASGGLMSYGEGSVATEKYRFVGNYTGRILHGEKPADLPVQQPTKIELVINLKAAKTLGLTIPAALLARADELIE